jgi:DNA-binding winged helix-turn-helix (wHTH) protein
VETLARRGYRFIAPVETVDLPVAQASSDGGRGPRLDAGVSRPAEPSSRLSENGAGHKTAGSVGPSH